MDFTLALTRNEDKLTLHVSATAQRFNTGRQWRATHKKALHCSLGRESQAGVS